MAVAFDAATESIRTATTDPYTFSHTGRATGSGGVQGVVVMVSSATAVTDEITAVTYGGVALTEIVQATDSGGEASNNQIWFVGSGLSGLGGTQTVSVDLTSASGTDFFICAATLTGSTDLEVVASDQVNDNIANPSVTLSYQGRTCIAIGGTFSGVADPSSIPPNGNMTAIHDHDWTSNISRMDRQTTPGTSDFTFSYTAISDDVALGVIAVSEVVIPFDENFEGGTDGTTITTANTKLTGVGTGGTATFENTAFVPTGSTYARVATTAGTRTMQFAPVVRTSSDITCHRFYYRTANPTVANDFWRLYDSVGGAPRVRLDITTGGLINFRDANTIRNTSTKALSADEWVRFEVFVDEPNDQIRGHMWWGSDLHSTDTGATNYESFGTRTWTQNDFNQIRFGHITIVTATSDFEGISWKDASSVTDFIGPPANANSVTSDGTFTTNAGDAPATGGSTTFNGDATFDTVAGSAPADGGSTTFTGGASFDTTAGDAPAAGGSTSFTGTAVFDTLAGDAVATGGSTTFDVSINATFTTTAGDAPASGGSTSLTGGATFDTVVGVGTADGGSTTFNAGATFTTTAGDAAATGGSTTFDATVSATFTTNAGDAPASGGSSSFTGDAAFTTVAGVATADGGSTTFNVSNTFTTNAGDAVTGGGSTTFTGTATFTSTSGDVVAAGGITTFEGSVAYYFQEDFEGTGGAAMSGSNTDWDLFNGAGTRTLESTPTPMYGATLGKYNGGQSLTKDTTSLPGTTNGGSVQRVLYYRGYYHLDSATSLTLSRLIVFEESVANGGADVAGVRMNANGTLRLMDATTAVGTATTKALDTSPTRIEFKIDQDANTMEVRVWWGADLHSSSTGATNYESQTGTLATNTDMEVFGTGFYASQSTNHSLYVEEVAVGTGGWLGPVTPYSNGTFDTVVGVGTGTGGSTTFNAGATFDTVAGVGTGNGGSSSFTGTATFSTVVGVATATGGSTTFDTTAGATFTTVAGEAIASGGSTTFTGTGSAAFDTTAGEAIASGGSTTFTGTSPNATFTTVSGSADAGGGETTFTIFVDSWYFIPPASNTANGYQRGPTPNGRLFSRVSGSPIHYCVMIFDADTTPRVVKTLRPNTTQMEAADYLYIGPSQYEVGQTEYDILATQFPDALVPVSGP